MPGINRCLSIASAAAALAAPASAQDSLAQPRDRWTTAFTVGVPGAGAEPVQVSIVGLQFTNLDPGSLSGDFAIGIAPVVLAYGALAFGVRAGTALPMQMTPTSFIVPSAGASIIGAVGGGGSAMLPGGNVGLSLVRAGPSGAGVRFGVTWHKFVGAELSDAIWLAEFGVLLPKRRPSAGVNAGCGCARFEMTQK